MIYQTKEINYLLTLELTVYVQLSFSSILHLLNHLKNNKCGALRNLVLFVQFKDVKNTHEGVLIHVF